MSDLISRADAIEAVCGNCLGEHFTKCNQKEWCEDIKALSALPSAEAEMYEDYEHATLVDIKAPLRGSADAVQRWIPCSERLPSEGEVVLASWSCLWKGAIVLARRYEGKWEWAYEHGADYWQPTELEEYWPEAWMPLPEPYKGGGDE